MGVECCWLGWVGKSEEAQAFELAVRLLAGGRE